MEAMLWLSNLKNVQIQVSVLGNKKLISCSNKGEQLC